MNTIVIDASSFNEELRSIVKYKIPYASSEISDVKENGNNILVTVKSSEDTLEDVSQKVRNLVKSLKESYIEFDPEVVFENEPDGILENKNIYGELLERGWVVHYDNGLIGFGGEFLELFNYFEKTFKEWAARYNAREYVYPDLIEIDTLNKYNYISQFPNHILFASHLREDMDTISSFSKEVSHDTTCINDRYLDTPKYVNKSAVCPHVYKQFENRVIDPDNPVVVTSVGRCKRYESLNMNRVERLMDFNMREIVLMGPSEFVLNTRSEFIELAKAFIKELGLKAAIKTSNDPFFTGEYSSMAIMQKKFKLKYELGIILPYSNKELACGSFNYHGSFFTDTFNIKSKDERPINTGCIAFGLERLVYAYLCQKGLKNAGSIIGG